MQPAQLILLAARNEAERLRATLTALAGAFPQASVWVADDGSTDETAQLAERCGAGVVRSAGPLGKGGAMTLAAERALRSSGAGTETVVLLCDGDLGESAARLGPLVRAVAEDGADVAVARFARPVGGGFGIALGYARRSVERHCGLRLQAPLSGQRAMRASTLRELLPFAPGFGMEVGMALDAARHGKRIVELELELSHRSSGRTPGGFVHRGRQMLHIAMAVRGRRG